MDCTKNKEMINLYFDGELEKIREPYIFDHLVNCEECRLFFKSINTISSAVIKEEFPFELEKKILSSLIEKRGRSEYSFLRRILTPAFSYAAVILLLFAGIFFYTKMNEYKSEMAVINEQIRYQSQTIELLYNSLSPTIVHAKYDN